MSGGHLDVALETARFAPVFPCWPDKRPASRRGFKDATTDEGRIRRWWSRHPDHLVGIPTTGLLVVDLDVPKDGDDRPRETSWRWWLNFAGSHGWEASDALMVATPSGGRHVYHRLPEHARVQCSAGKLAPLVDIRTTGGYVIAPGSTLPDGRSYDLLTPDNGLPQAPSWLIQACARSTTPKPGPTPSPNRSASDGSAYGQRALEAELGRLATAAPRTRNNTLNESAYRMGQLVAGGQLAVEHAARQLLVVALRIGLSETESTRTIRSGLAAGAKDPRRPRGRVA